MKLNFLKKNSLIKVVLIILSGCCMEKECFWNTASKVRKKTVHLKNELEEYSLKYLLRKK